MAKKPTRKIGTLCPWFGGNRTNASIVGSALQGCAHVSVLFAGGMSELPYVEAPTIIVNDLHRHAMNLASVVAHPVLRGKLLGELRRKVFHPDELERAQWYCKACAPDGLNDLGAAISYFVAIWMNRSAQAGTDREFKGNLPIRWNSFGGDSAVRYRSAVRSMLDFRKPFERCNFTTMDVFEMLDKLEDGPKKGIYSDAPWPDAGEIYAHKFDEAKQRELARRLTMYDKTKVVVRYGDHPLIRELYPEPHWQWVVFDARTQNNDMKSEVRIVNRSAFK